MRKKISCHDSWDHSHTSLRPEKDLRFKKFPFEGSIIGTDGSIVMLLESWVPKLPDARFDTNALTLSTDNLDPRQTTTLWL